MTIERFAIHASVQRHADPEWRSSRTAVPEVRGWLVELIDASGASGLGYAHALPAFTGHAEGVKAALDVLLPAVVGRDPFDLEAILAQADAMLAGASSAKAGIDMALWDLQGRLVGRPIHKLLGGRLRPAVPVLRMIPLKAPAAMAEVARGFVAEGYRTVKLKVSGELELDTARIAAVRSAVGPGVAITIDANQAYSAKGAIQAFRAFERHDIALFEQPVPAGDLAGLKLVTDTLPIPVEADESASSVEAVLRLVEARACDSVSLKPPKLGGLRNVMVAARLCEAGHIACRIGTSFGPGLMQAVGAQAAAALRRIDHACEVADHLSLIGDPFSPLAIAEGRLTIPDGPGAGVELTFRTSVEQSARDIRSQAT